MYNVTQEVKGDNLILTINLKQQGNISRSGKSRVIGSSEGNVSVAGNENIKFGLNVYRPVS